MGSKMRILAIETSCDETSASFVEAKGGFKKPRFKVFSNAVSSQIKIHRPFGGVVPNLAKREHLKNLPIVLKKALGKKTPDEIDLIAVTVGPGLEPCLWTGINFAKELARQYKKPLIGASHLEGHIYSFLLKKGMEIAKIFPAITLLASGGHTTLLLTQSLTKWKKLGETRDDAAGEAFDKVARLLNLPYPGGPEIEKIANYGSPTSIDFPRPMMNQKNCDFSFSGLKTAVLYYLKNLKLKTISYKLKADTAASFQQAAIDVLIHKTVKAAEVVGAKSIILCGGVAANKELQRQLKAKSHKLKTKFITSDFKFNTDNAAMVAAAAYINHLKKKKLKLIAQPNLNL